MSQPPAPRVCTRLIQTQVQALHDRSPYATLDVYVALRGVQQQAIYDYKRYSGSIQALRKQSASPRRNSELRSLRLLRTAAHHLSHLISRVLFPHLPLTALIGRYRNNPYPTLTTASSQQPLTPLAQTLFEISRLPDHPARESALFLLQKLPPVSPVLTKLPPAPSAENPTAKQLANLRKQVLRSTPNLTPFEKQALKNLLQSHKNPAA